MQRIVQYSSIWAIICAVGYVAGGGANCFLFDITEFIFVSLHP